MEEFQNISKPFCYNRIETDYLQTFAEPDVFAGIFFLHIYSMKTDEFPSNHCQVTVSYKMRRKNGESLCFILHF